MQICTKEFEENVRFTLSRVFTSVKLSFKIC